MSMKACDLLDEFIDAVILDQEKARKLIQEFPELLCIRRSLGETALHFLAIEDYPHGVQFLAHAGADVNTKGEFGDTPLIDAVILGHMEVVHVLLSCGADPNAESFINGNALHCAIHSANLNVVTALLQAGADPNYCTSIGDTVFSVLPKSAVQREAILAALKKFKIGKEKGTEGKEKGTT